MRNNGLSGKTLVKKRNWVFKEKNENKNNLAAVLNILRKNKFQYVANFLDIDESRYAYKYVKGTTIEKVICMPLASTLKIIDIIVEMQKLFLTEDNNVIVHGDLSPVNVIFDKNLKPKKVIDWDGCYFGSKYDDVAYVCWLWVNFGDDQKDHRKYMTQIIEIFKYLNYSLYDVQKIKAAILQRIERDRKNARNKFVCEWYEYTKNWVLENWKEIENEFS